MQIPKNNRKKALLIIDVQDSFIIDRNKYIIPNIKKLINSNLYECIIYSITYNEKESLWYKQIWWTEESQDDDIILELKDILDTKDSVYKVSKLSRSIFKWNAGIIDILDKYGIKEVHLTGYESNDCVLTSTLEAFDLWYYSFMIEEASETRTTSINHKYAVELLRYLNLTNNSNYVNRDSMEI